MKENEQHPKRKRQPYSPQFKDQALERASKEGIAQTARDLGIAESMLYAWRAKRNQTDQPLEQQKLQQAEMAKLKREVSRLEEEIAFLKKAAAYFAKETKRGAP
jgi:transposase